MAAVPSRIRNPILMLCMAGAAAWAQSQILIGQTSSFSGPVAAGVKEGTDGARLYLPSPNAYRKSSASVEKCLQNKHSVDNCKAVRVSTQSPSIATMARHHIE